ncbi:MAG: CbiQ family ECF transporter T component [Solirubrobacterales bacterium]
MNGPVSSPLAYVPRKGPLQSAGPLAASAYLGGFLLAGLFAPEPLIALAAAAGAAIAGIGAGVGRAVRFSLGLGLGIAVVLTLVNAIASDRGATVLARLGEWPGLGQVQVTAEAVAAGAMTGLRAVAVMVVAGVWSAAVDPDRILARMHRVAGRSALTATLVSRFLPLAAADRVRLKDAAGLRGPAASPVTRAAMARRLLEGSLDRSVEVAATLELRGYSLDAGPSDPLRTPSRYDRRFLILGFVLLGTVLVALFSGDGSLAAYPRVGWQVGPATVAAAIALLGAGFATWPGGRRARARIR